ncbi:T9SS type A sorting domain-containing protein [Rufibacter sp. DG15C]|uniref:T9SS type A sorting domain-containing protein n=1 Tax=Rufibacter sp. DG15C TaxID=1379909 RepID=UPI0009E86A3B|nr:T9SS type A sorting domain-containing protein [Rufibacter sp. DG15C]
MKKISTLLFALSVLFVFSVNAQNVFIPFGSTWSYLDNGSNQGTSWKDPSFTETTAWKSGLGKFGYGIDDAVTTINYGPTTSPKYITTYFRKTVNIPDLSSQSSYSANIKMDDGVVVYVNGAEVLRYNMPTGTIAYNTLASISSSGNGTNIINFAIPASAFVVGTNVVAVEVHQQKANTSDMAFDLELIGPGTDVTPPAVVSINRQAPTASTVTSPGTAIFRATFSEAVTGVTADDFTFTVSGSATATIASVTAVGTKKTQYDISINLSGVGTLRLNLKSSATGIIDSSNNLIATGYTSGQTYTLEALSSGTGFSSVTNLSPMPISINTADKPQSKVWQYAGKFWTVLPTADGTFLWRLDGTTWTKMLSVYGGTSSRADCKVVDNVVHVLLYRGSSTSYLVSLEYVPTSANYKLWSARTTRTSLTLGPDAETATLDRDGTGRLWIAYDTPGAVNVLWSDSPYTTFSAPIVIQTGIVNDDICSIIALPTQGKIGVLWSNQSADFFGFKTHNDGDDPNTWSVDEKPASQSALKVGTGFADDHLNMKIASDGTLYCAVKTSYESPGYTKLALLVRRPTGIWDNAYEVTEFEGTRPMLILNEAANKMQVIFTSHENGGDILYRESAISNISFSPTIPLLRGLYNYTSSTKDSYTGETVIIATDVSTTAWKAIGFLVTDGNAAATVTTNLLPEHSHKMLKAYPNPFQGTTTVLFTLPTAGDYTLALYNNKGEQVADPTKGNAAGGVSTAVEVKANHLPSGLYILKLQTAQGIETMKLLHTR